MLSVSEQPPAPSSVDWLTPEYHEAVIELLGVLAYGELQAFERLAADASMAPDIIHRAALAEMAVGEFGHYQLICARIVEMGADAADAMEPFRAAIDGFHASTAPADWLEGMVKAYVGDGIGTDFYREVAVYLDPQTKELVDAVCDDLGHSAFFVDTIREEIERDPVVAGRLALWGRRLMGEALVQAQNEAAEHQGLASLMIGGQGPDLIELGAMFKRLTDNHRDRMMSLGLRAA